MIIPLRCLFVCLSMFNVVDIAAILKDDLLRLPSLYAMIIPLRCLFVNV
jgi:hypothetical protein